MGMFDEYITDPPLACKCGANVERFQGKDGPLELLVFKQGHAAPVCDHGIKRYAEERLPREFELYTECNACKTWIDARGYADENGKWTETKLGSYSELYPDKS